MVNSIKRFCKIDEHSNDIVSIMQKVTKIAREFDQNSWYGIICWIQIGSYLRFSLLRSSDAYTILEKCCYTPIWGNKLDMDQIFVPRMGWNWHKTYLWLLNNKIRPHPGWTFTSMPSGIVKVQSHS